MNTAATRAAHIESALKAADGAVSTALRPSPIYRFAINRDSLILKNFAALRLCARKLLFVKIRVIRGLIPPVIF